jgi:hypothetical protein
MAHPSIMTTHANQKSYHIPAMNKNNYFGQVTSSFIDYLPTIYFIFRLINSVKVEIIEKIIGIQQVVILEVIIIMIIHKHNGRQVI